MLQLCDLYFSRDECVLAVVRLLVSAFMMYRFLQSP